MHNLREPKDHYTKSKGLLELLESQCDSDELRNLAGTMLRLADAMDQDWDGQSQSAFSWGREARRIERDAFNLAMRARREQKRREGRKSHLPAEFLGEPAWDMLLELFCQFAGGAKVSVKSLTYVSGLAPTTALRMIERLVEADLVARSGSETDGRVVLLNMTQRGVVSVGRALKGMS